MLASLLFPYDDDAPALIDTWLGELEAEGCIVRYKSGAQSYVQLCNWLIHQKIDKPSKSKIPPFVEPSRILANPLEVSSEEGIKDQGRDQGEEGTTTDASAPAAGGGDGAKPGDLDPPKAAPLPPANPALALTLVLRPLGVNVMSTNPIVIGWADRGVSVELLAEAVRIAREHKGDATIPPQYLAPIVERLLNPQPERRAAPRPGAVNEKFNFSHLDRSGDRAAMEASMQRHGITVPGPDEEIEI